MKTKSVRLTNGETIENVLEVQFSADGAGILQIDVTDHAVRFGVQGLLSFFNGRIEHVYVWHVANGQLCHTKVYGAETSLFDNQLAEIEKELRIAYAPFETTSSTLELTDDDRSELYYAFRNRGYSTTLVKVAEFLRDFDKRNGREPRDSDWYNVVDLTSR